MFIYNIGNYWISNIINFFIRPLMNRIKIISDNFTFVGSKSDSTGEAQYDNQSQKNDDFNQSVSSNQDDDVPF